MAEASLKDRIEYGQKLFQDGRARNVGELQSAVKRKFGQGIPPTRLRDVFGTSSKKSQARKASGARGKKRATKARASTATATAPRRMSEGRGFSLEMDASATIDQWTELVGYLNSVTGGNPHFAIRLDGTNIELVAD
ncbi:MAG: hypothetical protein RL885_24795 [Planctomycetota bacterium]